MWKTRSSVQLAWIGLGAWLLLATGCGATALTPKPAGSAVGPSHPDADPAIPQASVVTTADDPDAVPVSSSIRKVTVYSDRALVSREGAVKIGTSPTVYAFRQLPGWVDEGSVRAATTAGRILDVRVARGYLARATEQSYLNAEASARSLNEQLLALDDEIKVLDAQSKQIEDIKAFSLDKLNKDVVGGTPPGGTSSAAGPSGSGSVGVGTYAAVVDFIASKMREIAKGRRRVQAEREKLSPEVDASKKRLDDLRGLTQLEETRMFVTMQSTNPADGQLQLTYMLPRAT
jgi:hypothetical protein